MKKKSKDLVIGSFDKSKENHPCVCGLFRKGARISTQIYDKFLQPSGLKVTQYSMLSVIKRHEDITVTKLAAETLLERTTCTRNLKILENKSLIRILSGDDKRVKRVTLTVQGTEALKVAVPLWEEAQAFVFSELGEDNALLFLESLQKTLAILRQA